MRLFNIKKIFKKLDYERSIHSIKTAIGCLVGLIAIRTIPLPIDQWLVITIIVVMCAQVSMGGLMQKSYMRFLGTLLGTTVAALTLIFFGANTTAASIILCLSAMLFSYFATSPSALSESGTLGAVTIVIILLNHHPTLQSAPLRFLEISGGILIALLISRFIFPISAQKHLKREIGANLSRIQDFCKIVLHNDDHASIQDLENSIISSFTSQRKLTQEAVRESLFNTFAKDTFNHLIICQRELLRSMDFMHYALQLSPAGKKFLIEFIKLDEFNAKVIADLENLSIYLKNQKNDTFELKSIDLSWTDTVTTALQTENKFLSNKDIQHLNLMLFCARLLVEKVIELKHYIKRTNELEQGF